MSVNRGWAIGSGRLLRTTDGGATWSRLPDPPSGADRVRFATSAVGYAWAAPWGTLWLTSDGGRTWQRGGLTRVDAVETAAGTAWALAGEPPYPGVWRARTGSTSWTRLGMTPNRSATLDVHGAVAYVMGETGAGPIPPALDVWTPGQPVRHEKLPCAPERTYVPRSPLGVSTDGTVVLVCDVQAPGRTYQRAFLSTDGGRQWAPTAAPPVAATDVTAVPGRLFVWGRDLLVGTSGHWTTSLAGPRSGDGFRVVGFEDDTHGLALDADGTLHLTRDAGRTWRTVRF